MTIFTATFAAVAVTAAQDLFEIVAPADSRVRLREIRVGQYSDAGDAEAELLSIELIRGHDTAGSGGAAVTPSNIHPWSRAAGAAVARNNDTVATGGSPETLIADAMNVAAGWLHMPDECEMIWLEAGQRAVLRVTAPADSLTVNGTLVFEEMGLTAP